MHPRATQRNVREFVKPPKHALPTVRPGAAVAEKQVSRRSSRSARRARLLPSRPRCAAARDAASSGTLNASNASRPRAGAASCGAGQRPRESQAQGGIDRGFRAVPVAFPRPVPRPRHHLPRGRTPGRTSEVQHGCQVRGGTRPCPDAGACWCEAKVTGASTSTR